MHRMGVRLPRPLTMAKKSAVADPVADILAAIHKGFGKASAMRMAGGARSDLREVIPTGVDVLDHYVLGCGGLPVGRMIEVLSEEGAGKTSFLLSCLAGAQRAGGLAILSETEVSLDTRRGRVFGLDPERVVLLQPGHLDEAVQQMEAAMKAIPPGVGPVVLGWDSVAATPSKEEVEEGLAEVSAFDKRAKAISQAVRVLCPLAAARRVCLVFINQIRDKIGVMFGNKTTTPGGHALKFHASTRIQLFSGKAQKDRAAQHVGKFVTFLTVKNKLAVPFRKAQVKLTYATGWDDHWATLNHAKALKLIDNRAQGEAAWLEAREKLIAAGWGASMPPMADGGEVPEAPEVDEDGFEVPPNPDDGTQEP